MISNNLKWESLINYVKLQKYRDFVPNFIANIDKICRFFAKFAWVVEFFLCEKVNKIAVELTSE